jgi:hypothetical protein
MAHFVAFSKAFRIVCTLTITLWGNQGLLVIQKTILFTDKSLTDFRKKYVVFAPE